jgi:chromosomal replication initiator protein
MQDVVSRNREAVAALRRALAERVGAERYDLWFAATCGFEVRGERLAVLVPNSFLQDWLRTNFRGLLEQTAREVLGGDTAVVFEVDPQSAGRRDAEPPAVAAPATTLRVVRPEETTAAATEKKRLAAPRRLHTFDEFVVGTTNRLAYVSASGVVEALGSISPLVVYGPTGVGKSHLLEATVDAVRRHVAEARTAYISADQFTTEFLEALHGRGLPNFRRKFRDLHLLVVDDLQFLAGKKATISEFVQTLDALQRTGRQIVLAADRPPAELNALGPELGSRLSSGLACRLDPPDYTTRLGITARMAEKLGLALPDDVRQFVATHFSAHARELAGALKRLLVARRVAQKPLDMALAEEALAELLQYRRKTVRLGDIERAVCDVFGLESDALQSARKGNDVSRPRMLAMWLARKHTRAALSEIGDFFGGRSHSTVISAHKKVDGWLTTGEPLRVGVGRCRADEAVRKVEATLGAVG